MRCTVPELSAKLRSVVWSSSAKQEYLTNHGQYKRGINCLGVVGKPSCRVCCCAVPAAVVEGCAAVQRAVAAAATALAHLPTQMVRDATVRPASAARRDRPDI